MPQIDRRQFFLLTGAACAARALPPLATRLGGRRVLTLVYDKSLRMMRAVDRIVP